MGGRWAAMGERYGMYQYVSIPFVSFGIDRLTRCDTCGAENGRRMPPSPPLGGHGKRYGMGATTYTIEIGFGPASANAAEVLQAIQANAPDLLDELRGRLAADLSPLVLAGYDDVGAAAGAGKRIARYEFNEELLLLMAAARTRYIERGFVVPNHLAADL
jgi:hypothetical protein